MNRQPDNRPYIAAVTAVAILLVAILVIYALTHLNVVLAPVPPEAYGA